MPVSDETPTDAKRERMRYGADLFVSPHSGRALVTDDAAMS